ncbi:MAG: MFS transporter [Acetobacteraceae bacterium]|nr:MFS transporter [Acetobacteraceae bacterium]
MSAVVGDGVPVGQRRWAVATIVLAVGMASLDTSIANTALPTIAIDVQASPAASVWVVNAYQLALVATLLPLSTLGEIHGFRRVYLWGLGLFTIASLLCAMSWSLPTLTGARVLQGVGAAGIMSVNTALIRFIYPAGQLGRGVGFNAMVVGVSTAIGPSIAAGLLSVGPWPMLFAVNVPIGIAAMALAVRALPDTPLSPHRFDWQSGVLNAVFFGALIFMIGEAAHRASAVQTAALLAIVVGSGVALVRRQLRLPVPLLPIDLYRRPMFALSSVTAMCSFAAQGLAFVSLPFLFQLDMGRTAVETGLLLTPWPVATALMAPVAGPLSDRFPPAILGGIGMALLTLGLALMAALPDGAQGMAIAWRMLICGAGFGFFQSPNLRAIMSSAPPGRSGGASGIVATSRLMGQSTGAALVALCFGITAAHGPSLALALAAGFSGAACLISFSRLFAGKR